MKHFLICLLIIALLLTIISPIHAEITADEVFSFASVTLNSSKTAVFFARTKDVHESISVTSVVLLEKQGTNWISIGTLSTPTLSATNTTIFYTTSDYSSDINSGIFKIYATFCADGYSISTYSGEITY